MCRIIYSSHLYKISRFTVIDIFNVKHFTTYWVDISTIVTKIFKINEQTKTPKTPQFMFRHPSLQVRNIAAVENPTDDIIRYRGLLQDHVKLWEEAALQAFNRDLAALTARQHSFNMDCYMRCIPKKDYINIIVEEAKLLANGSETYSPTVQQLYKAMGSKVYARYLVLQKSKSGAMDKVNAITLM